MNKDKEVGAEKIVDDLNDKLRADFEPCLNASLNEWLIGAITTFAAAEYRRGVERALKLAKESQYVTRHSVVETLEDELERLDRALLNGETDTK